MRLFELPAILGSGGGGAGIGGSGVVHVAVSCVSTFGGLYYGVGACVHLVRVARHSVRRDFAKLHKELNDIESDYRIRRHVHEAEAELPEV